MILEFKIHSGETVITRLTLEWLEMVPLLFKSHAVVFGSVKITRDIETSEKILTDFHVGNYHESVEDFRRTLVRHALEQTGYNQTHAARLLGIGRKHLYSLTQKYKINHENWFSER